MTKKQTNMPQSGDRNDPAIYKKDARLHAERDKQNRTTDRESDRADEQGTGNRETRSPGSG